MPIKVSQSFEYASGSKSARIWQGWEYAMVT